MACLLPIKSVMLSSGVAAEGDRGAMNVLVVDSDVSVRFSVAEMVEDWGYHVEISGTAQDTIRQVKESVFDLVLLDICLPDMPAKDLIIALKKVKPELGIVTMTDYSTDELEKKIRTLGIIFYMSKPVNEMALKEILDHIAKKKDKAKV